MILNANGLILDLSSPKIMAILNLTPDSFFDGNQYNSTENSIIQINKLVEEGADIIDVGGMSSKPGSEIVYIEEEWNRIHSAIKYIHQIHPKICISIDTLHSEIARRALQEGAHMINDISGGKFDPQMHSIVGKTNAIYVMMHMQSVPLDMQEYTAYPKGIILSIMNFFKNQISSAQLAGISDVIIDPGFGFSKTIAQSFHVLNHLNTFRIFEKAILVGMSRKSMIYRTLDVSAIDSLNGTTALNMKALIEGANILRVHDVKEAKETILLFNQMSYINTEM